MKSNLTLLFIFLAYLVCGQDNSYRLGLEVIYPSGPATSDISFNSTFIGNYPGQYELYVSENNQTPSLGSSVSSIDSTTLANTIYDFLAIDVQSGDTICHKMMTYFFFGSPLQPYYGQTDSLAFHDTLISPLFAGDCNGHWNYIELIGGNAPNWKWRSTMNASSPWDRSWIDWHTR